jgi:hypothetical protein
VVMNCKQGSLPLLYLILPISGDACSLNFWYPLIDVDFRVGKAITFLWAGRLILLKYVISSLPVYFLSFFKATAIIISLLGKLGYCLYE